MDDLEKVVNQVKILSETVDLQVSRMDQGLKYLESTSKSLSETQRLLETLIQALKASLNESDQAVDDLATMILALQTVTAELKAVQQQESAE